MDVLAEFATTAHLTAQALFVIVYCMMLSLTRVFFNG